jgi:hypothetical protein
MTRGEFLRWAAAHTPWTPRPIADLPDEWLSAAWNRAWARHAEFLDNVQRCIGKLGGDLGEGGPSAYSRSLTVEEQVGLFRSIRAYTPWMEPSWRLWFERSFPECVTALPPRLSPAELEQSEAEARRRSRPVEQRW